MRKGFVRAAAVVPGTIAALLAGPAFAVEKTDQPAADVSQDVSAEIKAMRQRLDELETRQRKYDDEKAAQATAAAVKADAATQGSGIGNGAGGVNAGYRDGRFFIQNDDGSIVLRPWAQLQFRNTSLYRRGGGGDDSDDWQNGFEIRRFRLGIDGNLADNILYSFDFATYSGSTNRAGDHTGSFTQLDGGTPVLEEAWVLYHFNDTPWSIRAGQMHDPLAHEAIVGAKVRSPEASLQADIFANVDTYTQGVTAVYDPKQDYRVEAGVTDGIRSANTSFSDYPNNDTQFDFGLAGRAEYKVSGDWKDYKQMSARGVTGNDLIVLGFGADISQRSASTSFSHTFDAQMATANGWFFYASYFGRYTSDNPGIFLGAPSSTEVSPTGSTGNDTYEYSVLGQVAKVIDKNWEPFGRAEYLQLAGTPTGSKNNVIEFSVGLNYYLLDNNLKFTTQLMYLPNGIPIDDDSNDILENNGRGEVVIMQQFQLLL